MDGAGNSLPEWGYAYDALDQLIEVTRDGVFAERYRYDAFGRRSLIETANYNMREPTDPATLLLGLINDGSDRAIDIAPGPLGTAIPVRRYTHGQSVDPS